MPSPQNLHLDPGLTTFASAYENSDFFASEVSKDISMETISATFLKGRRRDVSRGATSDLVGADGLINEINSAFDRDTYRMDPHALMEWVGSLNEVAVNSSMNAMEIATETVMQRMMMNHELRVRDVLFTASNFAAANQITISTAWTNKTSGDPWVDIRAGVRKLPSFGDGSYIVGIGSDECIDTILDHPAIKEAVNGSLGMAPTEDELARRLGIAKICRSRLTQDTTNEGQATAAYARVWTSNKFGLYLVPKVANTPRVNCFALSFSKGDGKPRVRTEFDGKRGYGGSTAVIVEKMDQAAMVIQNDAGVLFTGTGA